MEHISVGDGMEPRSSYDGDPDVTDSDIIARMPAGTPILMAEQRHVRTDEPVAIPPELARLAADPALDA